MSTTPNSRILVQSIRRASAVCTLANAVYAGTLNGSPTANFNILPLISAGVNGSLLRGLKAIPRATVTATQLQLFTSPDSGTTVFLDNTALMAAATMSQTTQMPQTDFGYSDTLPMYLAPGWSLYVGIGVALAGGIVFMAGVGDF